MEQGVDSDDAIDNGRLARAWSPCQDKEGVVDGLDNGLFLDTVVVDARFFFQMGDGCFNVFSLKGLKSVFLQQPGQAFFDAFLSEIEAVVKDFGADLLQFTLSNQACQFLGNRSRV